MDFLNLGEKINVFYVISQAFALAATIASLISVQKRKKVQLLNYSTLSAILHVFHYIFLGAWSGMTVKLIASIRNGIATYEASKRKTSKIIPIIFLVFYVIGGIVTFKTWFSLFPMISSAIYTIVIYKVDVSKIRKYSLLCTALWLAYNICVFSIVGIISDSIFIIDDSVAIYRFRKRKKKNFKS